MRKSCKFWVWKVRTDIMSVCSGSLETERINNHTLPAWAFSPPTHAQAPRRISWMFTISSQSCVCILVPTPWQTMSQDSWAISWKWWIKPQIYWLPLMSGSVQGLMGSGGGSLGVSAIKPGGGWRCRQVGDQFETVCHGLNRLVWQCESTFKQWLMLLFFLQCALLLVTWN